MRSFRSSTGYKGLVCPPNKRSAFFIGAACSTTRMISLCVRYELQQLVTAVSSHNRYIIIWKLCWAMRANGFLENIGLALGASNCGRTIVLYRQIKLYEGGPCYISTDLAELNLVHVGALHTIPNIIVKMSAGNRLLRTRFCWQTTCCQTVQGSEPITLSITTIATAIVRTLDNITLKNVPVRHDEVFLRSWEQLSLATYHIKGIQHNLLSRLVRPSKAKGNLMCQAI